MSETAKGATYTKRKTRPHYATIQAVDPHDGGEWDVLVAPGTLAWVARQGMGKAREWADTVRWTLLNPRQIFRGLRNDEHELDEDDWLCYVAGPSHAYDYRTGRRVPA